VFGFADEVSELGELEVSRVDVDPLVAGLLVQMHLPEVLGREPALGTLRRQQFCAGKQRKLLQFITKGLLE